ncbi:MAG: 2Fe-2S iron-sulfur cluster binding domain-containing protein [Bacteroidetes bacterium]|nr:MAG: 2Fe-2S iron-sulfur cluster binding domain-containing protein [Bacteroidota bacterium]
MAVITIDGIQYDVDPKLTIIQAAKLQGIKIPHFCWHPKLSVAGNCRMCLVDVGNPRRNRDGTLVQDDKGNNVIDFMPKLAIACSTPVGDGMVVNTKTPKVVNAQEAVMEFLLINHPLDCPICDEAGECKLQDYAYKYSVGQSRFEFDKVRKPKRVELGPRVMLDTERCIMCSRCVRFCNEIAKKPQLTFTQRGDHVELTTFPGVQLDNPYSMNTIDLCPVGALTNKDFRFKARVWEMSATETICVGCARGCNTKMWVRNNEILRLTPRHNPEVNDYWMCDKGRLETFKWVNSDKRIKAPMIRKEGRLMQVGWDEVAAKVASELRHYKKSEIAALGSAFATNEENYAFVKLMKHAGVTNIDFMRHIYQGDEDDILIRADKAPNSAGAKAVGVHQEGTGLGFEGILKGITEGTIKALYSLDEHIAYEPRMAAVLPKLDLFILHASVENETTTYADIVLSTATYAEKNGTFTNFQGQVQRIRPAVAVLENERALNGFSMSRLDKFGSHNDRWTKGLKRDARAIWRTSSRIAGALGAKWKYTSSEEVFNEMTTTLEAFKGMSYLKLSGYGMKLKTTITKSISVPV